MGQIHPAAAFLISGENTSGLIPRPFDNRGAAAFGYLYYSAEGASAVVDLVASHDMTAWMVCGTITAVTGADGSASISAFYPYFGARSRLVFSGAAGTAAPLLHWTPGVA